jgi:hypothetical protein
MRNGLVAFAGVLTLAVGRAAAQVPVRPDGALAQGARAVVAAVVRAARDNARLPAPGDSGAAGPHRLSGDQLTALYFRAAAAAARRLPSRQAGAYLVGLGLAIDDSLILRTNPLTAALCQEVESDAERRQRLAVLGQPTMRDRRDWAQHFVVSCALTEVVGPRLAEAAGLLKEQLDMQPGGSGFSLADLNADLAGVTFARKVQHSEIPLRTLAARFRVEDYVPDPRGLSDGLSAEEFSRAYGTVADERFRKERAALRRRVLALYEK